MDNDTSVEHVHAWSNDPTRCVRTCLDFKCNKVELYTKPTCACGDICECCKQPMEVQRNWNSDCVVHGYQSEWFRTGLIR